MEDKNQPCLVLQYDYLGKIVGLDITTTYNYWEKEAFIDMNKQRLFPCKANGIKFKDFLDWIHRTQIYLISDNVNKIMKSVKDKLPQIFYPGYD